MSPVRGVHVTPGSPDVLMLGHGTNCSSDHRRMAAMMALNCSRAICLNNPDDLRLHPLKVVKALRPSSSYQESVLASTRTLVRRASNDGMSTRSCPKRPYIRVWLHGCKCVLWYYLYVAIRRHSCQDVGLQFFPVAILDCS